MILFHCNRSGRTSFDAQAALKAAGFVFEYDRGQAKPLCFFKGYAV